MLKDAVPNDAVIGEEDGEAIPAKAAPKKPAPKGKMAAAKLVAKPAPPSPPPAAKVETAVLRITSAPEGAVVRTKYKVLGQTPINLRFKTGNTYELQVMKRGYNPATRKVAVNNAKDRKIAVALKKKPVAKKKRTSFFHPHR
jgi:hypothetical protein